jgi:hypothetical protein
VVKRWLFRIVLLGTLAVVAFLAWHLLFPGPEQLIRKQLAQLSRVASIPPNESQLGHMASAQKLTTFFTPDTELVVDVPGRLQHTFNGREELLEATAGVRSTLRSLTVEFFDLVITLAPDKRTAVVQLTAKATMPGESVPEVQRVKAEFKNNNGEWLISRAETVKALR